MSTQVPASELERQLEVRKSRFIARAGRVVTREQAMAFLEQSRQRYPDARHHCWAYLLGDPAAASSAAMNDDGEPGGTAGKPILNVIQHKAIGDVMVVVSRYFGGIKLGAGGLVRAYAGATDAVLAELPLDTLVPQRSLWLTLDFPQEQPLRHWAEHHAAEVLEVRYAEQVSMQLSLPTSHLQALLGFCAAHGISPDMRDNI
ncbi:MAG: YigZ family protein [Ectothiorhodospiraceae bacterium]|nr:YigZ family protein [Ectothiorhodospiraceae bacterium]